MKNLQSVDVDVLSEKSYDLTINLLNKFKDIILAQCNSDRYVLDEISRYIDNHAFSNTLLLFSSHLKKNDGINFNLKAKLMLDLIDEFNMSYYFLFQDPKSICVFSNEIKKINKNLAMAFAHDEISHLTARSIDGFIKGRYIKIFEEHEESTIVLAHESNEKFTYNSNVRKALDDENFTTQLLQALINHWYQEKTKQFNEKIKNRLSSLKSIII